MRRKLLLLTIAAGLALHSPARADLSQGEAEEAFEDAIQDALKPILTDIIAILQVIIQTAGTLPEDPTQLQLADLNQIVGAAQRTYLRLERLGQSLQQLYPDQPDIRSLAAALQHAALRHADRQDRILEAMELAATIAEQRTAIDARIAALRALNLSPAGNLAAGQIGNEAVLQVASSIEMLTRLTAELGQLEADQRAQEDWARIQANSWMKEHYKGGFWTGTRTWTPGTFRRNF
jgi:P-type conjugative transfer protein TrbJ